MNRIGAKTLSLAALFLILTLTFNPLIAQGAQATMSGTITDPSGKAVPNAKVSVKNLSTGETTETQTDASGVYHTATLPAGEYEVNASAEGIGVKTAKVTLGTGSSQAADPVLSPSSSPPSGGPSETLPNAPSATQTAPSLEDLGFSKADQQGNAQQQALLDKRTHMLKIHQRLGLIAAVPIAASVITSFGAGGRDTSRASRDLHMALGAAAGDLYFTSAYFAIRAPKIEGTETRGPIRLHKALAWIHGPGMILTPILGAMAFEQKSKGEKVHGIAAAHGPVAIVTAGAFGAALLSVSVKF